MMCSCPKCAAEIELNTAGISEEGSYAPCPECKSRFWIGKESFARRALQKEGKLYCDACGKELGCLTVCTGCGVVFPDYYLLQMSKPQRRQVEKAKFSWSFGSSSKPAKQTYSIPQKSTSVTPLSRKFLVRAACLVVFAALSALGVYLYQQNKMESEYALNYVRALYGMKSGTDFCLKTCVTVSADWKAKADAGQRFVPHIAADDESHLNEVKDQVDKMRQKMEKPPQKFRKADEAFAKLYSVYVRLNALTVTPPSSLPNFTDSVTKLDSEFKTSAQELKAALPAELSKALEKARTKYSGMKDF